MDRQTSTDPPRDSEAQLRAILETAVDGIITIDERGVVQSMNPAAERIFGYDAADVVGQNVNMLMPSPYREEHDGYLANYVQGGPAQIIGIGREVSGRMADGREFPLYLAVSEVPTANGRLFTGIVRDITAQREAEAALRQQRDFADSLIDTAQVIVLLLDSNANIVRFNHYLEELSGHALADVVGLNWFDVFIRQEDRDRVRGEFEVVRTGTPTPGFINSIRAKNGKDYQIAWWAKLLQAAPGQSPGILAVGHDMTQLHAAQSQLVQSERLAAIGQMMAGLAHESRNALQRSQACLEMLELEVEDNLGALDQVRRIQRAQDDLNRLFDEVRNYAAPIQLDRTQLNLSSTWREAWSLVAPQRAGRHTELREISDGEDLECSVDVFRLVQVFRNLMENSLAATDGDVEIRITCAETTLHGRPAVHLRYHDNGPGLDNEQRSHLFDPFFTTKTKGTGLGMPIARRILEAHGGQIEVGEPGSERGAAFDIYLPREVAR